jgi:DnaJ-class molecular chaperone
MVPLEVPVRCTCHECGGRGETWTEPCHRCQGSGNELRHHQLRVALPAGVLDGTCFNFTVTPRHNPPTRVELRVLVA